MAPLSVPAIGPKLRPKKAIAKKGKLGVKSKRIKLLKIETCMIHKSMAIEIIKRYLFLSFFNLLLKKAISAMVLTNVL